MNRQIEVLPLSSRVVHVAVLVVMIGVGAYFALLTFATPMSTVGLSFGVSIAILSSGLLWWELRSPRFIVFMEGRVELRSFVSSVAIPDGELVSVRPSFVGRAHPWTRPSRVVVRFNRGHRIVNATSSEFAVVVAELKARNPDSFVSAV